VGAAVVDILEAVAGASYFVMRKLVNAVLQALGPVGDVFEWLLDRGEDLASGLWRDVALAVRFVKESVTEILDWAAAQTEALFEKLIAICEDIGASMTDILDWAIARGGDILEFFGGVWDRIGNAYWYALNYLENDFIPGIAKFVKGALAAGLELAKLVVWAGAKSFEVMLEVVRGAMEAGATIVQLVANIVREPQSAINHLVRAGRQLGQTLNNVVDAFKQAGEEFVDEFVRAMVEIGENIVEMLTAVAEVFVGWIDTVVILLMNFLNGFRSLTPAERADGELVFADTIDWDRVFIATDTPTNSIIFGIQDWARNDPASRAFVTGNLINFDADDVPIERFTLIHELTHVWQNQNVGPIYLGHAIFAQVAMKDEAYNYGYVAANDNASVDITVPNALYDGSSHTEASGPLIGQGGQLVLDAKAAEDFMDFTPEQQGQIAMQYFVRRALLNQSPDEYAAWEKFINWVRTHPQAA
jgi:hypothetical protein